MIRKTSAAAYQSVLESGYVGKRQKEVYEGLFQHGPCTINELWAAIGGSKRNVQANLHARANELVKLGVVSEIAKRECAITGKLAIVFQTNDNSPIKPIKPTKVKCSYCNGKGFVEQGNLF